MRYQIRRLSSIYYGLLSKVCKKKITCDWKRTLLERNVTIDCRSHGTIKVGYMTLEQNVVLASSGLLSIGNNVFFNRNTIVVCRDEVLIGDNCIFGPNVCVYDHNHVFDKHGLHDSFKTQKVIIGNNCWIGAGVIILKGTCIGDNCVIGAGTVLSGTIPKGSIVKNNREIMVTKIV
jgi:acetyltransferase-like isoleucine patch superfamily enzyme